MSAKITTPEEAFGFIPGTENTISDWQMQMNYYRKLEKQSDRLLIHEMASTPENNPFTALIISSPENLKNLDRYMEISHRLADCEFFDEDMVENLASEGKAIVVETMSIHAHEVGGAQTSPVIVHHLLSDNSHDTIKILDNVIYILFPSANPDGLNIEANWYNKYKDTHYSDLHYCYALYHKYAGHSNNRDGIHENLIELQCINDYLYRRCHANIEFDVHHVPITYHRMVLSAPGANPLREELSPLLVRELGFFGTGICQALEEKNIPDVVYSFNDIPHDEFTDDGYFHLYQTPKYHNIIGILCENAHLIKGLKSQYQKACDCSPKGTMPSVTNPHPWKGGEWKLSDLVNQIYEASIGLLRLAANNRYSLLRNTALKASRQTETGALSDDQGYLILPNQYDISALERLLKIFDNHKIKYFELCESFTTAFGVSCPQGSIYIPLAQPNYALASILLKKRIVPDNRYTRRKDNTMLIQDCAAANIAEWMGIDVISAGKKMTSKVIPYKKRTFDDNMEIKCNSSYKKLNSMLKKNSIAWIADNKFSEASSDIQIKAKKIGLFVFPIDTGVDDGPYTDLFLKTYGFDYKVINGHSIHDGVLDELEVLILPGYRKRHYEPEDYNSPNETPETQYAFGHYCIEEINRFVKRGGRLISWNESCDYIIENLNLPVENVVSGLDKSKYQVDFSTLRINCVKDDLTTGLPENMTILHSGGPCFVSKNPYLCRTIASFPQNNILSSGILIGESLLAGKTAAVKICHGEGDVILFGFSPQFRLQAESQFKFLLNALYDFEHLE